MKRFILNEPRRVCRDSRGFSLMELVVAILIFCVGILGMNRLQNVVIRGNVYSMQLTEATNIAKSTAETLMSLSVDSATLGGTGPLAAPVTFTGATVRPTHTIYTPSWTVSQVAGTNLRQVIVTVSWTDIDRPRHVDVTFFKGP